MDFVLQSWSRVRKLWILVLAQGATYLYLAFSYLDSNLLDYFRLGSIFVVANIILGLVEITTFRYFSKRLATFILPASLFDIFFGISIIFLPFISMIILPFYVGVSQILRGSIYLIIFNTGNSYSINGLKWLKYLGWGRIAWATILLAVFFIDINHSKILTGIALFVDGLIIISYGLCLKILPRKSANDKSFVLGKKAAGIVGH